MSTITPDANEIELARGKSGLGFNIRGGIDIPHLPEDYGIFVSKVHDDGTAAKDGRLKEGDKIVKVNGNPLIDVTHNEAVSYFRASDTVRLMVVPGAEQNILDQRAKRVAEAVASESPTPDSTAPKGITVGMAVAGVVVSLTILYIGYRCFKSKS